jgi:small-conductance mechanosensitive channel
MKPLALILTIAWLLCAAQVGAQTPEPSSSSAAAPSATEAPRAAAPAPGPPKPRSSTELDRSTPRRTVAGLLRHVEAGELAHAAQYLDLRGLRWGSQTPAEAAQQMARLLTEHVWVKTDDISDVPEGLANDGVDVERIASVRVAGSDIPITLSRVSRGADSIWLVSDQTVAHLSELDTALGMPSWMKPIVPKALEASRFAGMWGWQWLALALALLIGYPLGYVVASAGIGLLLRVANRTATRWDDAALGAARSPARIAFGLLGFTLIARTLGLPGRVEALMGTWVAIPIIVATGWAVMRAVRAVIDVQMVDVDVEEEMRARAVRTHLVILRRLASISIGFVTIAVALMRFELVRDLGVSLLASAGVAGVALGFAAQKSLGAVVAGLQLSIAQPVRLGDAIVWQGQWGTVEEITLTWVRLKLNDERRLIVPVDKFLTEAFENWSMPGTELIGLIEFPVDPTVPVDDLRAELHRLAEGHSAHDGRECLLQVIDLNERAAMVRARVSTSDVSRAFAMRCELREALMEYLRTRDEGRYLARQRWQDVEAAAQAA